MRNTRLFRITTLAGLMLSSSLAFAADKLYVQTPATYDKDAGVNAKVKDECAIENRVPFFIQENAKKNFEVVPAKDVKEAGKAKALTLTIMSVQGVGGGAWSGPKAITVQGTLTESGKVVGTFTARRTSGGGAFGGYKSTCSIFERCAKTLGTDIATWLQSPSMNASLGELK